MAVMVVPTKRSGVGAKSQGRLMVMQGELSPLKDLAISLSLGGHIGFGAMGLSRYFHPLHENIWCTRLLAGSSVSGDSCHWNSYSIPGEG